jgi:hypothetical protein
MLTYNETRLAQLTQEFLNLEQSQQCAVIMLDEELRSSHISKCEEMIEKCLSEYEKYQVLVEIDKKNLTNALLKRRNKLNIVEQPVEIIGPANVAEAKQT